MLLKQVRLFIRHDKATGDSNKGKTTTTGNNSGGNTGGGNSGGGSSSGSKSNTGGLNGINSGANEGADWLRTGSGLTFEEFWGVTAYGMEWYTGFSRSS